MYQTEIRDTLDHSGSMISGDRSIFQDYRHLDGIYRKLFQARNPFKCGFLA